MARAGSGQFGNSSGGNPGTLTAKRARLNAIASNNASWAPNSVVTIPDAASCLVERERDRLLVVTDIPAAG